MPSIVCLFFLKMCLLEGSSTLTNSVHLLFVNLGNPIYYLPHLCLSSPVLPSHGAWVPWAFLVAQMVENLQCRRLRFNPWVRKIPWRREWQSTPVFLPGKTNGQSTQVGYSHDFTKSWARLSNWHLHTFTFNFSMLCSHSIVFNSLWPHGLQLARLPSPSPSPLACSNSCPSSGWCHPTISSSIIFSCCLQSFPASGSFLMSRLFASGGQNIGVSASASVIPMNIQDWFPLGLTGWISLQSQGLSRVFSNTTVQKHQFFGAQPSLWSNSHIRTWLMEKR